MTTTLPEPPTQGRSAMTTKTKQALEEVAERITVEVAKICGCAWESCTRTRTETKTAILSALLDERLNERDRCAKIADKQADTLRRAAHVVQQPTEEALRMAELAIVNAEDIARAIRKGN